MGKINRKHHVKALLIHLHITGENYVTWMWRGKYSRVLRYSLPHMKSSHLTTAQLLFSYSVPQINTTSSTES